MDTWQLVHSDGEIVDADDASSISSDWSVMNIHDIDTPGEDDNLMLSSSSTSHLNTTETQIDVLPRTAAPPASINRRRPRRPARHRGRANIARHSDTPPTNRSASATTRQALAPSAAPSVINAQLSNRVALLSEASTQRRYIRRGGEVMSKPPQDKKHTKWLYGGGRIGTSHQRPKVRVA